MQIARKEYTSSMTIMMNCNGDVLPLSASSPSNDDNLVHTQQSRKRIRNGNYRTILNLSTAALFSYYVYNNSSSSTMVDAFHASTPLSSSYRSIVPTSPLVLFGTSTTSSIMTDEMIVQQLRSANQLYDNVVDYEDDFDDDDEEEDDMSINGYSYSFISKRDTKTQPQHDDNDKSSAAAVGTHDFFDLQKSMGSDVLPNELQKQIDEGATVYFNKHVMLDDTTELEKLAMSSITEQLPQPAIQALSLSPEGVPPSTPIDYRSYSNNLNFVTKGQRRVSVEEEIRLARLIQRGSELYQVKKDMELKLGREISKQEWATSAGFTSTRELRRCISDYRNAKHDLVKANMGLVHTIVKQQWYNSARYQQSGITRDELIQEGSLGLIRAAELFDPNRGLRFSTYAVVWIKGMLQNSHIEELVKLPAREKIKLNKITQGIKTIQAMNSGGGGSSSSTASSYVPTAEEIATVTGLPIQDVIETQRKMQQTKQILSLDYQQTSHSRSGTESSVQGDNNNLIRRSNSNNNIQDENEIMLMERTQLQADLIATMARNLDSREARLMRLRYGLTTDGQTRSIQQCADAMGLSYTRVNQLAKRCLEKLRQAADAESLEEYLLTIA